MMEQGLSFLPDDLRDLSPSRQRKIAKLIQNERQDAAMNAVKIGLKCLNEIYGFGFARQCRLARVWQNDIIGFYEAREAREPQINAWLEDIGFVVTESRLNSYRDQDGNPVKKSYAEKHLEPGGGDDDKG